MSGQYSLTNKEKEVILQMLRDRGINLIFESIYVEFEQGECEKEDQYNDISIVISQENEEKWYIQVN